MNEFMERITQRSEKLAKRAEKGKMGRDNFKTGKKTRKVRVSGKRDWLNKEGE